MTDSQQDGDGTSTGHATVSVAEAARRLGVTPDAIRSRLHRGTLEGEKVDNAWRVRLPEEQNPQIAESEPTGNRQNATGQSTGTDRDRQERDSPATVDLTPMTELIERLSRHNADLSAAAAGWQARAMQAEDRLKQLTATVESAGGAGGAGGDDTNDQAQSRQVDEESPQAGIWARVRRWWTG